MVIIPKEVPPEYAELYENLSRFVGKPGIATFTGPDKIVTKRVKFLGVKYIPDSVMNIIALESLETVYYALEIYNTGFIDLYMGIGTSYSYKIHNTGFTVERINTYYKTEWEMS